ncbi:hypothetical protein AM593_01251, partial [Mytilus galloprovincialis]
MAYQPPAFIEHYEESLYSELNFLNAAMTSPEPPESLYLQNLKDRQMIGPIKKNTKNAA